MQDSLTICGIRLHLRILHTNFADSTHICGFHLHFAESTYSCGIRNPQQNKCADKIYFTGICMRNPLKCFCGIHLRFGTYFKTCLWNPGIYRHKIVLLSSAQFGLVMTVLINTLKCYKILFTQQRVVSHFD